MLVSTHYMDEAERCHAIAYIAYGKLLARGTVEEVVQQSGLSTWMVSGAELNGLSTALGKADGIDMVAPFGSTLHVSGADPNHSNARSSRSVDDKRYVWRRGEPSLEDVFIRLMATAPSNY